MRAWVARVAADLPADSFATYEVQYRYGIFHTAARKNPQDASTCHPADLYRVAVWMLNQQTSAAAGSSPYQWR
jgi:hypothetical protein